MKGEMKGRHGRPFMYREHFYSSSNEGSVPAGWL